jgi:hypothetical protein
MLNCELCNYFKTINLKHSNKIIGVCEYTDFVFQKNIEDYEIEYPCYEAEMNKIACEEADTDADERKLA